MAIKLKTLEQISQTYTEQKFLYKDLGFDIDQTQISAPGFKIPVPGSDINASFDIAAIRNSLQNLFSTSPGQRFLYPEYGLDLKQFLFSPISEANGSILGNKIFATINNWEPRVSVQNVEVLIDPDNNQYVISIYINIPVLKREVTLESLLDIKKQSFVILPTSQIR
jgi:phage baseplate assembly protein W